MRRAEFVSAVEHADGYNGARARAAEVAAMAEVIAAERYGDREEIRSAVDRWHGAAVEAAHAEAAIYWREQARS